MNLVAELPRSPRVQIALPCTLRRLKGSPIAAQTLNVGAGGMLVTSVRPLAIDEEVDFDLANLELPICGHARVLRQQLHDSYALRFERLADEMERCLHALVVAGESAAATVPAPQARD
jgi:hypothetical protein